MNMEPFNDPRMGVSGLKPAGWSQPELGLWVRLSDQAVLFQRQNQDFLLDLFQINSFVGKLQKNIRDPRLTLANFSR